MIPEEFQLNECPSSGSGVHRWVFGAACYCTDNGLTDEEAEPLIKAAMTRNPMPSTEIMDALRSARREERVPSKIWAPRDDVRIKKILETLDPIPPPVLKIANPGYWLDWLFPGNPLLCMGKTNYLFDTKPKKDWHGWGKFQSLIVPSAMSALKGRTKAGHLSAHSFENTGPRQYLVIEFDTGTMEEHWKLLFHLAKQMPLVLVCSSGGKSLHGWFNVKEVEEIKQILFMQTAVALGADPRTWLVSQFVRMPDGTRYESRGRQPVIYFNSQEL
jgi:hypothetical protein